MLRFECYWILEYLKLSKGQRLEIDFHICSTIEISDNLPFLIWGLLLLFKIPLTSRLKCQHVINFPSGTTKGYPQYMPITQLKWQTRYSRNSNIQLSSMKHLTKHKFTNVKNVANNPLKQIWLHTNMIVHQGVS